ncbi:MAG: winged helix-turn-helix transcriptional regulator [Gaiellales bacterium]
MRSYGQYCAVAKALDVVGDRWNLLIVRELLLRGPSRYTDLLGGLPGIATNLLADRLRQLEQAEIVERYDAPPPVATTLFRLTPRGEELRPVVVELVRWGAPLMAEEVEGDVFRSEWVTLPAELYLHHAPDQPPVSIELRVDGEAIAIEASGGEVRVAQHAAEHPDLTLSGPPRLVLGTVTGQLPLRRAIELGLQHEGDLAAFERLQGPA